MSFDIFRFSEEGRIMEHWDSTQWSPFPASFNEIGLVEVEPWWPEGTYSRLEEPLCTSPMMEGETEIRDLDKTQQNKEIARQFVQDILMDKRFDEAEKYLADNMTHHVCYMHDGKAVGIGAFQLRHSAVIKDRFNDWMLALEFFKHICVC